MARLDGGRSSDRAISVLFVVAYCFAQPAELQAQAGHPFAAPRSSPLFGVTTTAAVADVNRDGSLYVIVPSLFIGTLVAPLDEDGCALANNIAGPYQSVPLGMANLPQVLGMAGGDLDHDGRDDLITVTSNGTVHLHRNLGSTQLTQTHWQADVIIDDFHLLYPASLPFVVYAIPVVHVLDYDLDGLADVVFAGGPVDRWGGNTLPGFVAVLKGDGMGGFQALRHQVAGSVIDVDVADLDGDGVHDGLVVLVETGAVGVFSYEIQHLHVNANALLPTVATQAIGPGRLTALVMVDLVGDGNSDYVVAQTASVGSATAAAIFYFEGDGQGHLNQANWGTLALPANSSGMSDFITSMQIADFNRDSHPDLVALRGYVQPPAGAYLAASYQDAEVLVMMGPSLTANAMQSIALPGSLRYADTATFALAPLSAQPEGLRCVDLGGNACLDLLVVGLRYGTTTQAPLIATIKNTSMPLPGDCWHQKVGEASGGVPTRAARIGFDGGPPVLGNASYSCSIQNVQGGCLLGLMWSSIGIPDLFAEYGFSFHIAPEQFGYARLASGSQAQDGFHSYPLPIPNNPNLIGDVGCFQYCYYDHVAGAFGGTQATCVWVGN